MERGVDAVDDGEGLVEGGDGEHLLHVRVGHRQAHLAPALGHTTLADDEHAVALVVITASRGGRSVEVKEAHVFHMRDGKVVEFWNASTDMYAFDEFLG